MTATRITVDNITYRVLVEYDTLKRSFELMEGDNSGTAISGRSIRDILGTNYKYTMTVRTDPSYPSDFDAFYWKISEPVDSHQITILCGNNIYDESIWQKGSISNSTGNNASNTSTTYIRTTTYLDSSIKVITPINGYRFCLVAYDSTDAYIGIWNGTSFVTGSNSWRTTETVLSNVTSSNYKYRLVLRNSGATTMAANGSSNLLLDTGSISFEAKILSGDDVYKGYYMNHKYWDELEVTFEPMEPQRK